MHSAEGWRDLGPVPGIELPAVFFLWWPLLTSFPVPDSFEMKPPNGPWSIEAIGATSVPSLYKAQASRGALSE